MRSCLKINKRKIKKDCVLAQVVEHFPEVLSSHPSTAKKKKRRRKEKPPAFLLLHRCFSTWATPPAPFTPDVLETGFPFLPRSASILSLLFYASHHRWDSKCVLPGHLFFLFRWEDLMKFLPWLAWNYRPSNLSLMHSLEFQVCSTTVSSSLRWGLPSYLPMLASNL
jgi:hypothetical protein